MTSAITKRLQAFGALPEADVLFLEDLSLRGRQCKSGSNIVNEGDEPGDVRLIRRGVACRYKETRNKRQIVAYLLAGEFCDLHVFILERMDHNISAVSDCEVVDIPRQSILDMLERPALARALLMTTLVDEATLREWIVNIGARPARNRLAHLFCEIFLRMKVIGEVDGLSCEFPINQSLLAETVGLSIVHVNKSLKSLREEKVLTFRSGRITIMDSYKLQNIAGFKTNYLHLLEETSNKIQHPAS